MISARGLRRSHGSGSAAREVLRGIDLDVDSSEFVAVMGPSGCGKSTLLALLGGLDTPDAGSVLLDGVDISQMDEEQRAAVRRDRIGIVFQQFHLVPSLTVAENVALSAIVSGARPRRWRGRALELLALLGLDEFASRQPAQLSGGEQQRVAVARAVFHEPDVLLADEPTGSLDSENGSRVLEMLSEARSLGAVPSIVMVTHDVGAATTADRVIVMRDGAVRGSVETDPSEGDDGAQSLRLRLANALG